MDDELSFRLGVAAIFFDDCDSPLYDYYCAKRNETKNLRCDYEKIKRNKQNRKETKLDTLRKQKIKLMRMKKNSH